MLLLCFSLKLFTFYLILITYQYTSCIKHLHCYKIVYRINISVNILAPIEFMSLKNTCNAKCNFALVEILEKIEDIRRYLPCVS